MKVVTDNGEFDLGTTETTPTIGMTDFSRRVTDDFGVTTVVERGFSRRMSVELGLPFDTVDAVHRRLSDLRASPALWVADDRYVWLSLYGFYKDFDVDLAVPPLSRVTLTIDGLAETGGVTDNGSDPAIGQTSTLQLLQPAPVTNAMLTASNVAESDAAEWSASVGYGKGARVIRASTHRVYESLITGNVGRTPESEPAWWLDVGPTNRWAMFDQALGTATSRNGGVEVTLNGGTANAVSLIDLVGDTVRVRANGYDQTQPVRPGVITFTGLPGSGQVTVTVSGAQAAVGTLLIGRMVGLGVTEAAPTAGITDFSRKVTDDFGAVDVVERGYSKRMTARALIRSDAVDVVADRLTSVRARPSLWIGQSGVDAITVYGFVKDFEIEVGTSASKLSLTVEGLTKASPAAVGVPQLVPRGPYDLATIYAAGALVEDQGVTWRYINATPTSGYAPPKLPTTRNGFWQVFSSVGMTPEQQAAYDKLVATLTAITSDNIIAAGGEKNQIIQLYQQVLDLSVRAHTASISLDATYGGDPTAFERSARDTTISALSEYLAGLVPRWDNTTVDTPADGPTLRGKFYDAQAAANQLIQANSAYVSGRTKAVIDRANAIGSDNVLSSGSEKQQVVIDWNTLYQDLESLYAKYVELGSPADLTAAYSDASAARTALGTYLGSLTPPWNQIGTDTPIVSATWSANWTNAYQRINDLRAKIGGRKGDKGDPGVGLPGEPGKDGQTWYPYYAYANAPDGSIDFTTGTPGSRAYVGFATGTSPTEPTIPGLYAWSEYKGPPFGMATRGAVVVAGRQLVKSGGANEWDGDAFATSGFRNGAVTSFQFVPGGVSMAGLNTDPTADASYTSLDHAWHTAPGYCQIYENGGFVTDHGGFDASTKFQIHYDGRFIRYYKDGALMRGPVDVGAGKIFFFDSSLHDPGSRITDIEFSAAGTLGANGENGVSPIAVSIQPSSATFQAYADGTPYAGQLPYNVGVSATQAGSGVPVTGISIVASTGMTMALNPLRITAVTTADAYTVLDVSAAGQTQRLQISASLVREGADGSTSTRLTINAPQLTWTSFSQHGNTLGFQSSTTGKIRVNLTGAIMGDPAVDYVLRFVSKLQYRAAGSPTWIDVPNSQTTSTEGGLINVGADNSGNYRPVRAAINSNGPYVLTGLAADSAYEFRALDYKTTQGGSSSVGLSVFAERIQ